MKGGGSAGVNSIRLEFRVQKLTSQSTSMIIIILYTYICAVFVC